MSEEITIWAVCVDEAFTIQGYEFQIKLKRTNTVEDLKEVASEKCLLSHFGTSRLHILKTQQRLPYQPSLSNTSEQAKETAQQQDQSTASSVSEPGSIEELVQRLRSHYGTLYDPEEQLKTAPHYVIDLSPQDYVGDHFESDESMIQAIVLHPVLYGRPSTEGGSAVLIRDTD